MRTAQQRLGPYLREIPALPVGRRCGASTLGILGGADTSTAGWVYDPKNGHIWANTEAGECDVIGRAYSSY
jgi:hypothetical protein